MKRIVALFLTLAMLFMLAACGGDEDIRGEQTGNSGLSSLSSDEASDEQSEFSMGAVDGITYENKFIGIGCKLDSDWTFYSDDQIKELNNMAVDMAGDEFAEAVKDAAVIYDMYAIKSNQMDNINVNLEKVNALQLASLDIAKNFEQIFPTIEDAFANMGYTNIEHEIGTVKIDDKEFKAMNITAEINGMKLYQTSISTKCNGYLANIAITTYQENTVDEIIEKFYIVK